MQVIAALTEYDPERKGFLAAALEFEYRPGITDAAMRERLGAALLDSGDLTGFVENDP